EERAGYIEGILSHLQGRLQAALRMLERNLSRHVAVHELASQLFQLSVLPVPAKYDADSQLSTHPSGGDAGLRSDPSIPPMRAPDRVTNHYSPTKHLPAHLRRAIASTPAT